MYLSLVANKSSHLHRKTADLDDEILISPSMDEIGEVQEGLSDVEEALARSKAPRSGPYWPKIKATLLENSSTSDIDDAIKEWDRDGFPYVSREVCQLCGKNPIKFCFPIKNRVTHIQLVVGCECVHNYLEIGGYETPEELKKSLTTQLNVLKKVERGEAEEGELEAVKGLSRLETEVRNRLALVASGAFELEEYYTALESVLTVCNNLSLESEPPVKAASVAFKAAHKLNLFMTKIKKKQKFQGSSLKLLLDKILAKREPAVKEELLETYLERLNALFGVGRPADVISRAWGAVECGKNRLVGEVAIKCAKGKAELADKTKDVVSVAKPYGYLSFLLGQGLKALNASFDAQLESVRKAVESEDFIEQVQASSSTLSKILSYQFYPDLANAEGPAERGAYKVIQFVESVSKGTGAVSHIIEAIESTYRLGSVRVKDLAGIRVSLLRAADDDSILDVDVMGSDAVVEFSKLIREKNPQALALIQKEVDEIALLIKSTGNQKVYELMSEKLGFDVERVYKLYTADKPIELDFCTRILDDWLRGRLVELSIARLENIHQQISFKGRTKEVRNSMWRKLESRLTARVSQDTVLL